MALARISGDVQRRMLLMLMVQVPRGRHHLRSVSHAAAQRRRITCQQRHNSVSGQAPTSLNRLDWSAHKYAKECKQEELKYLICKNVKLNERHVSESIEFISELLLCYKQNVL